MKTLDTADSVAIVGARPTGVGSQWLIRNLRQYGFSGEVWPVSRKLTDFYGLKVYPSVEELPWAPSIAVLAVNPVETIRLSGLLSGEGTKAVVISARAHSALRISPAGSARSRRRSPTISAQAT